MNRSKFHEANVFYQKIKLAQEKQVKLSKLKDDIVETLKGYDYLIPEEKVYDSFNSINTLSKYLDEEIKRLYKLIDEL